MNDKDAFLEEWKRQFGDVPPISYMLKWRLRERWVRIHSLPESKRYAASAKDWKILIERHFVVLNAVIEASQPYFVVENSEPTSRRKQALRRLVGLGSFSNDNEDDKDYLIEANLCEQPKNEAELTKIFKLIADDKLRAVFVQENRIFAPYDGGIDIILGTAKAAKELKLQYSDWLSKEPSGL